MPARTTSAPSDAGAAAAAAAAAADADGGTLAAGVYRGLAELLTSGQVAPGDTLSLRSLAQRLGTSPMPVREALRELAALGAVEILPKRAARVPWMGAARFRELLEIRLLLEGLAAERAAARITPAQLRAAAGFADEMAREIRRREPDRARLVRANRDLHFTVYEAAGSPPLLRLIEHLWLQIGPVVNLDLRQETRSLRTRPALEHHRALVEALRARDPAAAAAAVRADLQAAATIILATGRMPP